MMGVSGMFAYKVASDEMRVSLMKSDGERVCVRECVFAGVCVSVFV